MPAESNEDTEKVRDILKREQGSIKQAPLPSGSPARDDILDETWKDIKRKAKVRKAGYQVFRKLIVRPSVQQALRRERGDMKDLIEMLSSLGMEVHARGEEAQLKKLAQIEQILTRAGIHHVRNDYRENAVSRFATVPGQRWEIDVMDDGEVEVECFESDGDLLDELAFKELVKQFAND
jgi:hypothetical protein